MKVSREHRTQKADPSWRIGIVYSSFYPEEVRSMVDAAKYVLAEAGVPSANVTEHEVSGAFEIPLIGSVLVHDKKVDALIGLGIIVEGETAHARLVAEECARGIMDVQTRHCVPFVFEVLYVEELRLAQERATGDDNKGAEAARCALHSLAEIQNVRF